MKNCKFDYSVAICTFNGSKYIEKQIDSILEQPILPKEIIISDDGSQDDTITKIKRIFSDREFLNYKLLKNPKKGIINNFFFAISQTSSEIIFLSDQDDIWLPNKVEIFMEEFSKKNCTHPFLLFSDAILIDSKNQIFSHSFFQYQGLSPLVFTDDSIIYKNCVQGASCAFNSAMRSLLQDSLKVISVDNIYMHDWWLAILAKYYGSYHFIDKPLIAYRQHNNNQIGAFNKKLKYIHYILKTKHYVSNFIKAIKQNRELYKMVNKYPIENFCIKHQKYKNIHSIKKIILRCYNLFNIR